MAAAAAADRPEDHQVAAAAVLASVDPVDRLVAVLEVLPVVHRSLYQPAQRPAQHSFGPYSPS